MQLLVPLVSAYRYDGPEVNTRLAHSEAKILHEKIHHKAYSDDEIIRILTTWSKAQLLATFNYYNDAFGHPINKDLKADPKDEYLKTLRAIIRCLTCPDRYFEKVVRQAIAGLGTDESSLTRVITTRAEVDLKHIKEAYQKRNSVPLERAVAGDTSGDYESMLLALLGQE
ncbi:annexin D7-like [Setaria italica]|uniref:annexin D7-like n=1 Tax=Setaria italica TaxID=4555 RepID=UPI000647FCF2|nr:annexin D7-like [Setaria italica]